MVFEEGTVNIVTADQKPVQPAETGPYTGIDMSVIESESHKAYAQRLA